MREFHMFKSGIILQAAQLDAVASAQEELLWQTFFTKVLLAPKTDSALTSLLKSLAAPHLQKFSAAMSTYLKEVFDTALVAANHRNLLAERSKLAYQYLRNLKRVV